MAKFDQALSHDPYHAPALQGRATALEQLGHSRDAERSRVRAGMIEQLEVPEYEIGAAD